MFRAKCSEEVIRGHLESAAANCGRNVPQREIEDAINSAYRGLDNTRAKEANSQFSSGRNAKARSTSPKSVLNTEAIKAITNTGFGLVDLYEASPIRFEDDDDTEQLIDWLFPDNPLLCCGWTQCNFSTKPREKWRGLMNRLQFIVPSPMKERRGLTKSGRLSSHTLANTGARHYLVIEFDQGSFDDHAARLWYLARLAPLVMVVHSGGKSLHGWFKCKGESEEILEKFMKIAVSIGADKATWLPSQFVRFPAGRRDNETKQAVYYFQGRHL